MARQGNRRSWALLVTIAGGLFGCGGGTYSQEPVVQKNSPPQRVLRAEPSGEESNSEPSELTPSLNDAPPNPPPVAERFPDAPFPPADPGAPFSRSAHEGDGKWEPFFKAQSSNKKETRRFEVVSADFSSDAVRRMVIHPHEASRFQTLTLAAFDLRVLSVAHHPGKKDVGDVGRADLEDQAGLVPKSEQEGLVAIFNGGFQPRHGRWGMLSLGEQLVPPRDDACTVAVMKDGSVQIAPWPVLKEKQEEIAAYRQTPPCLVIEGDVHPRLKRKDRKPWAGQHADRKTRRRSVVGVSADGRTLLAGVGSETEPEVLAAGMRHAGAKYAAQLDINWNWTRLFLFQNLEGDVKPLGSLIPDMARDRGEYITRAGARGFFYLTRRDEDGRSDSTR